MSLLQCGGMLFVLSSYNSLNSNEIVKSMSQTVLILIAIFGPLSGYGLSQSDQNGEVIDFREVSFLTSDGGRVFASLYGVGDHGVVLAHGAVFNKESWAEQSELLMEKGFRVLAIDFRGYGKSQAGSQKNALHLDVLAAVRYLHDQGTKRVSVVGGSMGGGAAAQAAAESKEGEIDLLILLAHSPIHRPQDLKGNKLFIVSIGDGLSRSVKQQYEAAPKPKKLVVLEGKLTPIPRNQSDSVSASLRVWYAPRSYFGGAPTFPRYHRLKDDGCKFLGPIYARLWHWTQWAASGMNSNRSGGMSRPQRAQFPYVPSPTRTKAARTRPS